MDIDFLLRNIRKLCYDMIVYQFINSDNPYNCANYFSRLSCYIPRFYDEEERQAFEMWLTKDGNQTEFSTAYQTNWTKESKFTCTNERNEAATGRTIVDMLKRFRRAQTDAKIRNMSAFWRHLVLVGIWYSSRFSTSAIVIEQKDRGEKLFWNDFVSVFEVYGGGIAGWPSAWRLHKTYSCIQSCV